MSDTYKSYRESTTFIKRSSEASVMRKAHPNKIPVIVERINNEHHLPRLQEKLMIPMDVPLSYVLQVIRLRLQLTPDQALFMLINNIQMPPLTKTMREIYASEKDDDGYLYIIYGSEETFGAE